MIIVYMGVVGSGKDYQSGLKVKEGFARVDFKDGLLDMASDLVGYDIREHYDFFKENIAGYVPSVEYPDKTFRLQCESLIDAYPTVMTGRRLLQRLGTEVMRKRDEDYWVKCFLKDVVKHGKVVNGDCRFMNEVRAIKSLPCESKFIFCNFKSLRYDGYLNHTSEKLAQALLKQRLGDLQEIDDYHFKEAENLMDKEKSRGLII